MEKLVRSEHLVWNASSQSTIP